MIDCDCGCHDPDLNVIHSMPCCDASYDKRSRRSQRKLDEAALLREQANRKAAIGPAYFESAMDLVWKAINLEKDAKNDQ